MKIELRHDVVAMAGGGTEADAMAEGYLLAAVAFGDQFQYPGLARRPDASPI